MMMLMMKFPIDNFAASEIFANIRVKAFFQQVNRNIPAIQLGVWPRVLETVESKPDLLFALLKTKPEVCREQQHSQRRRKRPDWLKDY